MSKQIDPLTKLTADLFLAGEFLDSKKDCLDAARMFFYFTSNHPKSFNKALQDLHIDYGCAMDCARSFVSKGIASWIEPSPGQNDELREGQKIRRDFMVLPIRQALEVLQLHVGSAIRVDYSDFEEEIAKVEEQYESCYGSNGLRPFIEKHKFTGVVPLLSTPKIFIFEYAIYLLRQEMQKGHDTEATFVTHHSTILNYSPLKRLLKETPVKITNYFDGSSCANDELNKLKEGSGNVELVSIPESIIRNDRYILISGTLIAAHLRPSPYKHKYEGRFFNFYTVDIINRKDSIKEFQNAIESWRHLGVAQKI